MKTKRFTIIFSMIVLTILFSLVLRFVSADVKSVHQIDWIDGDINSEEFGNRFIDLVKPECPVCSESGCEYKPCRSYCEFADKLLGRRYEWCIYNGYDYSLNVIGRLEELYMYLFKPMCPVDEEEYLPDIGYGSKPCSSYCEYIDKVRGEYRGWCAEYDRD